MIWVTVNCDMKKKKSEYSRQTIVLAKHYKLDLLVSLLPSDF